MDEFVVLPKYKSPIKQIFSVPNPQPAQWQFCMGALLKYFVFLITLQRFLPCFLFYAFVRIIGGVDDTYCSCVLAVLNFFEKSVDKCPMGWYYVFVVSNG